MWGIAVSLIGMLTCASAQQVGPGYQAAPVGTEFYVGTTTHFTVVEHVPGGLITNNASNLKATWSGGLTTRNLDAQARVRLADLFPLAPGKELTYEIASDKERWLHRLTVQRAEPVDVNGRRFDTFVVTRHEKGEPPNRFEGEYTMWFSPEYGFPLKMTYRHVFGDQPKAFADWQVSRIVTSTRSRTASSRAPTTSRTGSARRGSFRRNKNP